MRNRTSIAALVCVGAVIALPGSGQAAFPQLLHKAISGETAYSTNSVFSPYSVATALSMLRVGTNGTSRIQIAEALGRNYRLVPQQNVDAPGINLRLFNAFYYDTSVQVYPNFIQIMRRRLNVEVDPQPFLSAPRRAVDAVNRRVELETVGKIRNVLPPPDSQLVGVLVSTIYMKADWKTAFDEKMTRPGKFTTASGTEQRVDMMNAETHCNYLKDESIGFTAVALPYKDERFQMVLVLPDRGSTIGDVTSRLSIGPLFKEMRIQKVVLKFPKFRVKTDIDLRDVLHRMGIREIFSPAANLQRMSPDRRLYVSSAKHSAVIETDERGSEAAAATTISISARSFFTAPKPSFVANRPFSFHVYDVSTGNVLFSGQVADAAAAQGKGVQEESLATPIQTGRHLDIAGQGPRSRGGGVMPLPGQLPRRQRPISRENSVLARSNNVQGQFRGEGVPQRQNSRQPQLSRPHQQPRYPDLPDPSRHSGRRVVYPEGGYPSSGGRGQQARSGRRLHGGGQSFYPPDELGSRSGPRVRQPAKKRYRARPVDAYGTPARLDAYGRPQRPSGGYDRQGRPVGYGRRRHQQAGSPTTYSPRRQQGRQRQNTYPPQQQSGWWNNVWSPAVPFYQLNQ